MPLRLNLDPSERVIVNGAVLRAHPKHGSTLFVENHASILREDDVMLTEEADKSPSRRLYYLVMLAYIYPEQEVDHCSAFADWLAEVSAAYLNPKPKLLCSEAAALVARRDFYRALQVCRELIEYEDGVLSQAA